MSYYTKVSLVSPKPGAFDPSKALDSLKAKLTAIGVHHDVIDDLHTLFATGTTKLKIYPVHVWEIIAWVSRQQPDARWVVRGQGEDERSEWTCTYRNGARVAED
jgi:hypothetical protein